MSCAEPADEDWWRRQQHLRIGRDPLATRPGAHELWRDWKEHIQREPREAGETGTNTNLVTQDHRTNRRNQASTPLKRSGNGSAMAPQDDAAGSFSTCSLDVLPERVEAHLKFLRVGLGDVPVRIARRFRWHPDTDGSSNATAASLHALSYRALDARNWSLSRRRMSFTSLLGEIAPNTDYNFCLNE